MPEYKITMWDIVKGVICLILAIVVITIGYWLFIVSIDWFLSEIDGRVHPLTKVVIFTIFLFFIALFSGLSKTIESGFNYFRLFEKFKKREK